MALGITGKQVSPQAFLNLEREWILYPAAADANYFSSATDGGSQGNFDISAAAVGTAVFLSVGGKRPLRVPRAPTLTVTDASGSTLTCTVRIVGKRFGRIVTQDLVMVSSGTLVEGSTVIDEMTSATIIAIANNAASDVLVIGTSAVRLGLLKPIKSVKSVKLVEKLLAGAPDTGDSTTTQGIRHGSTVQTSSVVFVADSSIKVAATGMFTGGTEAATDIYCVEYVADGLEEFKPQGRKYG